MNTQLKIYDNRGTALNLRHYREYPYQFDSQKETLSIGWIFAAIFAGLFIGICLFG